MDVDRFPNYRELTARRADARANCGHPIAISDRIGWNPKNKRTQCAACWARWTAENAAADVDERMNGGAW